jgi:hypothetical protein
MTLLEQTTAKPFWMKSRAQLRLVNDGVGTLVADRIRWWIAGVKDLKWEFGRAGGE